VRILYMSGYTDDDVIIRKGLHDPSAVVHGKAIHHGVAGGAGSPALG